MPSLSQKVIQFNNSKKAKCPYNKPHMSNSSDINNFDILIIPHFKNTNVTGFQKPPGPLSLTTCKTVFLCISLCFRRYSDLLVRCFASLDRPCFAFARPRGRDRGSIDLLGAVLIGPGVAHQVGPSFPPCESSWDTETSLGRSITHTPVSEQALNSLLLSNCSTSKQSLSIFNKLYAVFLS